MVADEENVAIAYSITGTHERDFQRIAPTERTSKRAGCRSPLREWPDRGAMGSSDELGILKQLGANPTSA
jgi:hypothetical protein